MNEPGVLDGIRVLEVSQGLAGPYCGRLLCQLGASVIKVEPPEGDWARTMGPPWRNDTGAAAAELNRGKSSVVIDLETEEGRALLDVLLAETDVLVLDTTPLGASTLGLESELLEGQFPGLVICSISPLGAQGEWAERPATELEIQALSGLTRYLGQLGDEPIRIGADVGAVFGAAAAVQGVLAALFERCDSDQGQTIEVSQLGALIGGETVMLAALDEPDAWEGFHCGAASSPVDHGLKTKDGVIYYGAPFRSEEPWQEFCMAIGAHELPADPRFATKEMRMPRMAELRAALQPSCLNFTSEELLEIIAKTEGIGVPMNDFETLVEHPQFEAMGILTEDGSLGALSPPWRFGVSTVVSPTSEVEAAGSSTTEVLTGLGIDAERIGRLATSGVIGVNEPTAFEEKG